VPLTAGAEEDDAAGFGLLQEQGLGDAFQDAAYRSVLQRQHGILTRLRV